MQEVHSVFPVVVQFTHGEAQVVQEDPSRNVPATQEVQFVLEVQLTQGDWQASQTSAFLKCPARQVRHLFSLSTHEVQGETQLEQLPFE